MTFKKTILTISSLALFFLFGTEASAATLYLLPQERAFGIGQEFTVTVGVRTDDATINAAQAIVRFPNDKLRLETVDRIGSIFNFWVEEPAISNEEGTLSFIGGTSKGTSGTSLVVLKLKFTTTGAGIAELSFSDAIVTANDGKGTNILSSTEGTSVNIGTEKVAPPPPPPLPSVSPAEQPKKVEREAVPAKAVPAKPTLRVPLYPEQDKWYNHSGETIMFWELPSDITQISTRLSKTPDDKTGTKEDGLSTGKSFGVLDNGIWYLRAQFKNNIGWSETSYFKVSIDTTPPVPFEIGTDSTTTDNPTPEINFDTQDSLSGLGEALIIIDDKEIIKLSGTSFTLPALAPGKHTVRVRVFDNAGNSVEDDIGFDILPLPAPAVHFLTKSVARDEIVFASGSTLSNTSVIARVYSETGREVFSAEVESDEAGNWEVVIENALVVGKYTITATAKDNRGALSYPTDPQPFKVKQKPVFSIGTVDVGLFELLIILILLVISGVSIASWFYVSKETKDRAYAIILGRDVTKLTNLLEEDLLKLEDTHKREEGVSPQAEAKLSFITERMKENMGKMIKYVGQQMRKLE